MIAFHLLTSGSGTASSSPFTMILLMVAMFAIMYFVMIRPQKKQQKKEQEMRDSLQVGDEITTIGGIMGRVVTVKEDSLIIETGADRNKMRVARWAVQTNNTANEKLAAEREAAQAKAQEERAKRSAEEGGKKTPRQEKRSGRSVFRKGGRDCTGEKRRRIISGISLGFPSYSLSENVRGIFYEQREKEKCI